MTQKKEAGLKIIRKYKFIIFLKIHKKIENIKTKLIKRN